MWKSGQRFGPDLLSVQILNIHQGWTMTTNQYIWLIDTHTTPVEVTSTETTEDNKNDKNTRGTMRAATPNLTTWTGCDTQDNHQHVHTKAMYDWQVMRSYKINKLLISPYLWVPNGNVHCFYSEVMLSLLLCTCRIFNTSSRDILAFATWCYSNRKTEFFFARFYYSIFENSVILGIDHPVL